MFCPVPGCPSPVQLMFDLFDLFDLSPPRDSYFFILTGFGGDKPTRLIEKVIWNGNTAYRFGKVRRLTVLNLVFVGTPVTGSHPLAL